MKKIILLTAFILFFASSAWSLYIYDEGYVNVGDLDTYLYSGTKDDLDNAGDGTELNWINLMLFGDDTSSYYTDDDFDKINTENGAGWFQAYISEDLDDVANYTFAYNIVSEEGETLYPEYFLVKTGTLGETPDYRWFLFDNNQLLDWAVINLEEQGYSLMELGKLSHLGTVGAAPVPEPGTLLLIGSGLIGLAGIRKKFARAD